MERKNYTTNHLPQSTMIFAQEFIYSATAGISNDTGQRFGFVRGSTAGAANDADTMDISFVVAAGTYTLVIAGMKVSSAGKTDGYLDDSAVASWTADDWYSLLDSNNALFSHSVTFATGGRHKLRLVVNGKNAASSDYRVLLTDVYISPSAFTVEA